jgi:hypothetical protein
MRSRLLLTLLFALASAAVGSAEPLPWSYFVRVNAPAGYDGILFGTEALQPPADVSGPTTLHHIWDTGPDNYGMARVNSPMPTGEEALFLFAPGFEQQVATLPDGKAFSPGTFVLSWGFDGGGGSATGSVTGSITASGLTSSGTGNYWIDLDHSETVSLGGRTAIVRFAGQNTESGSRIDMTVTELIEQPPGVPEPGTLVLGGIAVTGVGVWGRRKLAGRG